MARNKSERRWCVDPQDARDTAARIAIGVLALGAEREAVAGPDQVPRAVDVELDLPLQHVAEFLALMLDVAVAAPAGLDVIDETVTGMGARLFCDSIPANRQMETQT